LESFKKFKLFTYTAKIAEGCHFITQNLKINACDAEKRNNNLFSKKVAENYSQYNLRLLAITNTQIME